MRRLFDNFICIIVTICMFAFPVLLLGLAPWVGDSVVGGLHLHFGHSLADLLSAVGLMMGSVGGLMVLAVPVFVLIYMGLVRVSRYSHRMAHGAPAAAPATAEGQGRDGVRERDEESPMVGRIEERRPRPGAADASRPRVIRQDMRGRAPTRQAVRTQRPVP